ncbi:MAG: hypothetical protein RB191_23730, partial [Terriglobia bacterium]|nr:hypothetical protein [Terriglobia bacterium]
IATRGEKQQGCGQYDGGAEFGTSRYSGTRGNRKNWDRHEHLGMVFCRMQTDEAMLHASPILVRRNVGGAAPQRFET